jgi:hypothetical protein
VSLGHPTITFRVERDLYNWIERERGPRGWTRSELIRNALDRYRFSEALDADAEWHEISRQLQADQTAEMEARTPPPNVVAAARSAAIRRRQRKRKR